MTKKTVLVLTPSFGVESDFRERGWEVIVTSNPDRFDRNSFDFIAWMGGTDINPSLYGETPLQTTQRSDIERDEREVRIWKEYPEKNKLGICRGAQLLNVLNGGKLYQHVNNHSRPHDVTDVRGRTVRVCSVHHQMMIPPPTGEVIAWASGQSSLRLAETKVAEGPMNMEPEVVYFPKDKALCFQAHPEFGPKSCTDYFFTLINEHYGVE